MGKSGIIEDTVVSIVQSLFLPACLPAMVINPCPWLPGSIQKRLTKKKRSGSRRRAKWGFPLYGKIVCRTQLLLLDLVLSNARETVNQVLLLDVVYSTRPGWTEDDKPDILHAALRLRWPVVTFLIRLDDVLRCVTLSVPVLDSTVLRSCLLLYYILCTSPPTSGRTSMYPSSPLHLPYHITVS